MAKRKCVVIVDDEIDTVEMLSEMMRLAGYQAYPAFSGAKAIELIAETNPSAVLLDLMMPDLSGLDVLKYMRSDPRLEKTPVIIISAKSFPEDIQICKEAGANSYLSKPIAFRDLRRAIEQVTQEFQA